MLPLQVARHNTLRLGFKDPDIVPLFINGPFVEFRAASLLFKDEKSKDLFNGSTG